MLRALLVSIVIGAGSPVFAGAEPPPVFARLTVDEARAKSASEKKLLLIKATAEWCSPCKQMDKTTFRDEKVVAWLNQNAVAVELDVDKQPELAKKLKVRAMPTMILSRGDQELDRAMGYRDGPSLLKWLEAANGGTREIDSMTEAAKAETPDGVDARLELARALMNQEEYEEAADHFVWLWQNMTRIEPAMVGVRVSFMAGDMEEAALASSAAKKKFTALRDDTARDLEVADQAADKAVELRDDWLVLNEVVGDRAATLGWFDQMKADADRWPELPRFARQLDTLLIEEDRWADLPLLFPDPMAELTSRVARNQMMNRLNKDSSLPEGVLEQAKQVRARLYRSSVGQVYAGLLAAGKEDEALAYAAKVGELPDAEILKLGLAESALAAKVSRPEHAEWADAARELVPGADMVARDIRMQLVMKEKPAGGR